MKLAVLFVIVSAYGYTVYLILKSLDRRERNRNSTRVKRDL